MKYTSKFILNWEEHQFAAPSGWGWRQPWANTIAYYPFDTDYVDASGNSPTATAQNTVIWEYWGVNCLNFNSSYAYVNWINNLNLESEYTMCVRVYVNNKVGINYYWIANWWWSWFEVYSNNTWYIRRWNTTNQQSAVSWVWSGWHLLAQVWTVGGAWYLVVDWVWTTLIASWLVATWNQTNQLNIWALAGAWMIANQGYVSKLIIENKARTQQEMLDYYNQNKYLYGIS